MDEKAVAIVKAAGVDTGADLWRTLRASCEKEWAMTFPQYAVSKWVRHSITISGKHYANSVPDELFGRAAHKAAQQVAEPTVNDRNAGGADERETAESPAESRELACVAVGDEGFEPPTPCV
jgi:hypothetical protein